MEGERYEWKGRLKEGGLKIRIFVVECTQKSLYFFLYVFTQTLTCMKRMHLAF